MSGEGLEEKNSKVSLTLGRHPATGWRTDWGGVRVRGGPVRNPSQGSCEETMVPECGVGSGKGKVWDATAHLEDGASKICK